MSYTVISLPLYSASREVEVVAQADSYNDALFAAVAHAEGRELTPLSSIPAALTTHNARQAWGVSVNGERTDLLAISEAA